VLSIAKLRVDAEAYDLELVASGVDEYYSERGEVPGRWVGTGIEALGLAGQVGGEDLRGVLAGRDPLSGKALASPRKKPGFDLTFSAPKSVSVLFALTERGVAARVVAAHDLAVTAALGYLEREACRVRRGHAGARLWRLRGRSVSTWNQPRR
jgi:conjugative relaxase-like TrwC/TraI family protein